MSYQPAKLVRLGQRLLPWAALSCLVIFGVSGCGQEQPGASANEFQSHLARARDLRKAQKLQQAVSEYDLAFDAGLKNHNTRSQACLALPTEVSTLIPYYAPAREILQKRRDAIESNILKDAAGFEQAELYASLNRALEDPSRTTGMIDRLLKESKQSSRVWRSLVLASWDELLRSKDYKPMRIVVGDDYKQLAKSLQGEKSGPKLPNLGKSAVVTYQVLLGSGDAAAARELREAITESTTNRNVYLWMVHAAMRAGVKSEVDAVLASADLKLDKQDAKRLREYAVKNGLNSLASAKR